jgi:competence protein ComEC
LNALEGLFLVAVAGMLLSRARLPWAAVAGLLWVAQHLPAAERELAVLDVGQGTSVVYRSGERTLVYDTGGGIAGGFLQADKILAPYLANAGVTRLNDVVISHADTDHSVGAESLSAAFTVDRRIGFGGEPCIPGRRWQWPDGTRFTLLNGPLPGDAAANPGSCVLLIEAEGWRFLLAGDIPRRRERELVRYWGEQLRADVLLLAHHGSATSSGHTFLKWVAANQVVLSRARANRFGHPNPAVLARLEAARAEILDTAVLGTLRWQWRQGQGWQLRLQRGVWTPYWLRLD